jgi:transcription initiation factor TFIIA large subunit
MATSAINAENNVKKIYHTVIDEVITNIREAFLDEGYDEQLLQEMKHMWEAKLNSSRAIQSNEDFNSSSSVPMSTAAAATPSGHSNQLRLPTQPPTPRSNPLSNSNSSSNNTATSRQTTPLGAAAASPIDLTQNTDVKPQYMDQHTRTAIQTAFFTSSSSNTNTNSNSNFSTDSTAARIIKKQQQLDGQGGDDAGSSDEEDEEDDEIGVPQNDDDDDDDVDDKTNGDDYEGKEDPDPLNSDDDLTEHGSPDSQSDLFDTEHVIVCQYDKITRIKNKWKFHLKDGVMNINGKDYLFSKANGDAEW